MYFIRNSHSFMFLWPNCYLQYLVIYLSTLPTYYLSLASNWHHKSVSLSDSKEPIRFPNKLHRYRERGLRPPLLVLAAAAARPAIYRFHLDHVDGEIFAIKVVIPYLHLCTYLLTFLSPLLL
ncbi:hypothetical protein JYU34_021572 [Plutella xylostella]|uniref:Uncharacterized protein n=1 Tax=Plutella xylostella TaxID=51655 RepID=A0ABQ7PTX6_PLUXY|nr:hypothetical protein JYU34_021572 [Plutella xylostella]